LADEWRPYQAAEARGLPAAIEAPVPHARGKI